MRITEIQIDRFGVWQDLRLSLNRSGLHVFYGPNEAGKSTLLRFVRGVLYGFEPCTGPDTPRTGPAATGQAGPRGDAGWSGALRIEHEDAACEIRRASQRGGRGLVAVSGVQGDAPPEDQLRELLADTEERVFQNVFALGLHELQELATLHADDVAGHVYGMTLGPEGRTLLEVLGDIDDRRRRLEPGRSDREGDTEKQGGASGELAALLERETELAGELAALDDLRDRHAALCRERGDLERHIDGLKGREAELHSHIRQYRFLERVWSPWSQVRECRTELDRIPHVAGFPENGLERLDRLDEEIDSLTRCRDALLAEAAQLQKEAQGLAGDPQFRQHAATMQSYVDQRDWLAELQGRIDESAGRAAGLKAALEARLAALGSEWPADRLAAVDTTAAAHYRLTGAARNYRTALSRRARFRRRYQKLADACHQRQVTLEVRLKELGGLSLEDALAAARARLAEAENLRGLRLREADLEERLAGVRGQAAQLEARLAFPRWVTGLLACFGAMGVVFLILGLVSGTTSSLLSGLAYAFVGATCGLSAWALKRQFGKAVQETVERLQDEERQNEVRLRETREEIARLGKPAGDTDLLRAATRRVAELERLAVAERRLRHRRRQLTDLRARFRGLQRDMGTARQNWCEVLTQLGLGETVRIAEAFDTWQKVAEAAETKRLWQAAHDEWHGRRQIFQSWRQRIEELARRVGGGGDGLSDPISILDAWDEELKAAARSRAERHRLLREEKTRRAEAAEYRARLDDLGVQRAALLVQGGAAGREEFEQRAEWVRRREEFEELLALARSELDTACGTEPELAIVEDDLRSYDAAAHAEMLELLNLELEELSGAVQGAFEELGRVKQEIQGLEDDRRPTRLRFERAQVQTRLKRAAEKWLALQLASRAVDRMRGEFERTCQPATLAAASRYLERLTRGRYRRVWTPLGERRLCLDDERGRCLGVEQLSNGTREQLFLAVRLALVRELAGRGVELPVVLDDILVNFDQDRTESALDTLMEFAEEGGQVLLFTCHQHLVQSLEQRGVTPTPLPARAASVEERLAG